MSIICDSSITACFLCHALIQGLITLVFGLAGALLGLFFLQYCRAWYIGNHVHVSVVPQHGMQSDLRILNESPFTMCDVFVYISIKHTPSDIYSAQSGLSFITAANQTLVYEDRITWSLEIDGKHSPKMDIHPYERQAATFVMFDFANNRYIVIASEAAYKPARVHLAPHAYEVLLKVVAKDARQSTWMLKIDPSNNANPVSEPRSINEEEYEATLEKFRTNYYQ